MCYFIVLMSLLLLYNVENSKNKENPWMSRYVQTFDRYCTFILILTNPSLLFWNQIIYKAFYFLPQGLKRTCAVGWWNPYITNKKTSPQIEADFLSLYFTLIFILCVEGHQSSQCPLWREMSPVVVKPAQQHVTELTFSPCSTSTNKTVVLGDAHRDSR